MNPVEIIDKTDKNMKDLNQEIQGITRMKFKFIIGSSRKSVGHFRSL
jgi:hypothetical protein